MKKNIIKNIKSIDILTNVCMKEDIYKKEFYTYLVIEMKDNCLIYNITHGKDYSFKKNKSIAFIKGITEVHNLYKQEEIQYQSEIEFYELESIKLYKNTRLVNKHNNQDYTYKTDIIEFKDIKNNKFYISAPSNKIYLRENMYEVEQKNIKNIYTIYEKGLNKNIDFKIFKNKRIDFLKLFFEFID